MIAVLRRILTEEQAQSLSHCWTCVNCEKPPTHVITPGGYRLCDVHADRTYRGHIVNKVPIERR